MIDPLSRIPHAQKATSYDEGRINAQEGREQRQACGQICYSARRNDDFTLGVESQSVHLAVVGYLEQATLGASSFEGIGILHERDSNLFASVS